MKPYLILLALSTFATVAEIRADFADYYAFPNVNIDPNGAPFFRRLPFGTSTANNWTIRGESNATFLQDPYVYAFPLATNLTLDAGRLSSGPRFSRVEVTTIAPSSGLFSFSFSLTLGTSASNRGYYLLNGAQFALGAGSGGVTVPINAGDIFGFGVYAAGQSTVNGLSAIATLQVTNFSAPAPVPEPSGIALLLLAGSFAVAVRRRSRSNI